ncbi:MAG TPA: hypothetical protein PKD54_15095 [Pirellulaceae bacterium]|nr:hypothetical protein [Pirellulaceae bacterium]
MKDIPILLGGLILVLAVIVIWLLFPVYNLPDGKSVYRPVWDPPQLPIGNNFDLLSEEDIERLSRDPGQREILEDMQNLPRSLSATPNWIGFRFSRTKNWLFVLAILTVFGYVWLLRHKGVF